MRMHLVRNPVMLTLMTYLVLLFSFMVLLFISELGLREQGDYNRFENLQNAFWVSQQFILSAGVSGREIP